MPDWSTRANGPIATLYRDGFTVGMVDARRAGEIVAALNQPPLTGEGEIVTDTGPMTDNQGRRGRFVLTWHTEVAETPEGEEAHG
jgi:hypothetical protein